jgi:uncharacterized protein with FMN-binding domain
MSRSSLLLFAVALSVFGMAVATGHPPWGAVTGISIFLTAAAMAAGALSGKASPAAQNSEQRASSQKIPAALVTLSATAILAVYAAGYQRTRDAADTFEAQTVRHQSAPSSAVAVPPKPLEPAAAAPATVQTPATRQRATATGAQPSTAAVPKTRAQQPAAASEPTATAATTTPPEPAAPTETPAEPVTSATAAAAKSQSTYYKDGTFLGWGRCRHGSIQASVSIQGGQIVSTEIAQCLTRYPCSWIANLPGQVVTRQSANVDYVSGATESTDAFYDAVASALALARE